MASPQKELGHVSIANEYYEALARAEVPGRQRRVLDVIIRKTWGWQKKSDHIALSTIAEATGIGRNHIPELLAWLKAAKMIERDTQGKTSVQKDYEQWVAPPAGAPPKGLVKGEVVAPPKGKGSPARGYKLAPPAGLSKEIKQLSKENIGTSVQKVRVPEGIPKETAIEPNDSKKNEVNMIMEAFQMHLNPTINYGNKTQRKAAQDLITALGSLERVMNAIKYVVEIRADRFAPVVTTPYQLKEKLGALMLYHEKRRSTNSIVNLDNI